MIDYEPLYQALCVGKAAEWGKRLPGQLNEAFNPSRHGSLAGWRQLLESLPNAIPGERNIHSDAISIGSCLDLNETEKQSLETKLKQLSPWRKGPFNLHGIKIDAEWRSDWKWRRIAPHISPLKNRTVLDVGCGNGYYCWRMLGNQAKMVIGIDPTLLNVVQFHAIKRLHGGEPPVFVLPLGIEDVPCNMKAFDTVFSMGVFYHRRSPIDHLMELRDSITPGGELILETLVIDGELGQILVPEGRYAMMRNVWFLPTCPTLKSWLHRCGFKNIRLVDISATTVDEQRSTAWMTFHSLKDYLNPDNPTQTVEGHPAPKRAVFVAQT